MKYLITVVFGTVALCLSLILGFTIYYALIDSWQWWLVALGVFMPTVVAVLITSAALSAARDY